MKHLLSLLIFLWPLGAYGQTSLSAQVAGGFTHTHIKNRMYEYGSAVDVKSDVGYSFKQMELQASIDFRHKDAGAVDEEMVQRYDYLVFNGAAKIPVRDQVLLGIGGYSDISTIELDYNDFPAYLSYRMAGPSISLEAKTARLNLQILFALAFGQRKTSYETDRKFSSKHLNIQAFLRCCACLDVQAGFSATLYHTTEHPVDRYDLRIRTEGAPIINITEHIGVFLKVGAESFVNEVNHTNFIYTGGVKISW